MKIKVKKISFEEMQKIAPPKRKKPFKQSVILRTVIKILSAVNLKLVGFKAEKTGLEILKKEPCLVLMNHSSFIDLEIVSHLLFPKRFSIVCTSDAFVGLEVILRFLGCIPTKKFVSDPSLISDIKYALKKHRSHVVMFPEASYSFDGTATALPRRLGLLLKRLDVPVCVIRTNGAFSRQPLYNCLKIRKVPVSSHVELILTKEEIKSKTVEELDLLLDKAFDYDHFSWQQQNKIEINNPDRAEGLERILFKCPHCLIENKIKSKGIGIKCLNCGTEYELDPYGWLKCRNNSSELTHIPDWYAWERNEVKNELISNSYYFKEKVKIYTLIDFKAIYDIGEGILTHTNEGFRLEGCEGKLDFSLPPTACYGLYADYYWYEISDIICIGDNTRLYYCLPQNNVSVAKVRMATEELYKIKHKEKLIKRKEKTAVSTY